MSATVTKKRNKPNTKPAGSALGVGWSYVANPLERLAIWDKAAGSWSKQRNVAKRLATIRREWDRKLG